MNTYILKDANHILTPMCESIANDNMGFLKPREAIEVPGLANLKHALNSYAFIKYLVVFKNGTPLARKEANDRCKCIPVGVDNWKRLTSVWGLLEEDHIGPHNLHYWKITEKGKKVLEIAEANDAYYQVMKWHDPSLDEDAKIVMMMNADLQGENTHAATSAEGFIKMLDSIFNPESMCRKVGSCYRWLNNVVHMMKTSSMFFKTISSPEVIAWLDSHPEYDGTTNFKKLLNKAAKKLAA